MDIRGLENFCQKINRYSKAKGLGESLAKQIAEMGVEIAKEKYADKKVDITIETGDTPNKRRIVVRGRRVAFDEFGTGLVGQGTYEGTLPTEPIKFESPKGFPRQTQGWEYYYPNPRTKVNGGWYAGKVFHRGQVARAQLFTTSKELRNNLHLTAKNAIKEIIR